MADLFFFGTLRHIPLLQIVVGRTDFQLEPASLPDHEIQAVSHDTFPVLVPHPGASANGILVRDLTETEVARLDFYEIGFGFDLHTSEVVTASGTVKAQIYLADHQSMGAGTGWSLSDWAAEWGELTTATAHEYMEGFGHISPDLAATRYDMMATRAWATLNAGKQKVPSDLRTGPNRDNVKVVATQRPYTNFFSVVENDLQFRRFDGKISNVINRGALVGADAVTVLPYDPVRDVILLIEQFRYGPFLRGDPLPWKLEPVAGRIDPGEMPQEAVHRELREEAALTVKSLLHVCNCYPSPGMLTEYLYNYVAIADLPESRAGVAGLASEDEDIKSHILPFDRAMELISTGEIETGPLILSLLWLQGQRDVIRSRA
ncbi:MAG: NUDIX domain-containing protein [Marinosulfonomonas sp.]